MKQFIIAVMLVLTPIAVVYGDDETSLTMGTLVTSLISDVGTRMWNSQTGEYEGRGTLWVDCLAWATTQADGANVRSLYSIDDVRNALNIALSYLEPVSVESGRDPGRIASFEQLTADIEKLKQKQKDVDYIKNILKVLGN